MVRMTFWPGPRAICSKLGGALESNRERLDLVSAALKTFGLIIAPLIFNFEYRQSVDVQARTRALEEVRLLRQSDEFRLMAAHAMLSIDKTYMEKRKLEQTVGRAWTAGLDKRLPCYDRSFV